jgi:hypothetical protein
MMLTAAGLLGICLPPAPLASQERPVADSADVVAGPEYAAGTLHRYLLGDRYRDAWTATLRVPVLDLGRFGGGLTPVRRGGGVQTRTLRFEAPDGREYNFRSVNKSYTHSVPEWARGTLVEWLRADQTSAQHPGAAIAATPLIEAAGVLHPDPRLYVMPDDPRLGEFRDEFAGLLGTMEHHPNEGENDRPLFAGAPRVAGGDRVLEHLDEDPHHRLDTGAFLAERLISVYLNDWDRHIGQYRFARYENDGIFRWVPIPEDRDYAFVDHDGVLLAIARSALTARLITFGPEYGNLFPMLSNSADLVRRLLAPLDRQAWDSVATAVHAGLTDEAIDAAVATLPPEWRARDGRDMAATLRGRRAGFLEMATEFYDIVAAYPAVHGTEGEDHAIIERHADGTVTVRLFAPESNAWADTPYFQRRFLPSETREVRIFLSDGDDRAVIRGDVADAGERIRIRVIGGHGADVLADSAGYAYLYDALGDNEMIASQGTRVDTRPFVPPEETPSLLPNKPRDWGSTRSMFTPAAAWVPDVGFLIGGGPVWTRYDFRHHPFAAQHRLAALVHPGAWRGEIHYTGTFRPENSAQRTTLEGRASNAEVLRFHGFGNASPALPDDAALTWQRRYEAAGSVHLPFGSTSELHAGGGVSYTDPETGAGTAFHELQPYGYTAMGELGVRAGIRMDTRDDPAFPRRGFDAAMELNGFVPVTDSPEAYGVTAGAASAYVSLTSRRSPVLAFRTAGEITSGNPPVHRAAFLGGRSTLRGYSHGRFVGDAAAHGTAEIRMPLLAANIAAHGTLGLSAFGDAGRVWQDGVSEGGWHTAVGGALWFTSPIGTVSLEIADGEHRTAYLRLGIGL